MLGEGYDIFKVNFSPNAEQLVGWMCIGEFDCVSGNVQKNLPLTYFCIDSIVAKASEW